jgi:hypothetical protein
MKRAWPLIAALTTFAVTIGTLFEICLRRDAGHFVYVLDDSYIEMAIAKSLALRAVWGVTSHGFTSASSTFLWPVLLALVDRVWKPSELTPLVLSCLAAALAITATYIIARRLRLPRMGIFALLLAIIFLSPLPALVFTGMEHCLQIATALPFVYLAAEDLTQAEGLGTRGMSCLWLLTPVLTLIRYEGLFLVFPVCVLQMLRGRRWKSVGMGLIALAPAVLYGAYSLLKGWFWLPNPIYLKGNIPRLIRARGTVPGIYGAFTWSAKTADLLSVGLALVVLFGLLAYHYRTLWRTSTTMIFIVVFAGALHLKFAGLGWFFRYEAYLVALALLALSAGLKDYLSQCQRKDDISLLERSAATLLMAYCMLVPTTILCLRGYQAITHIPQASQNVFDQQYQMGLFLRRFYPDASVAVNDIGAVAYLDNPHLLDLWGLASLSVAKIESKAPITPTEIERLATSKKVVVAIVYKRLFKNGVIGRGGLPKQWTQVGKWTLVNNYMSADSTVSFFATRPSGVAPLVAHLRQFSNSLPRAVVQSGKYIKKIHRDSNQSGLTQTEQPKHI